MRFFPTIAREARAVREAMLTRGLRLDAGGHRDATRRGCWRTSWCPTCTACRIVADELGDAGHGPRRGNDAADAARYHELRIGALDGVVLVAAVALVAVAAVAGKVLP